MPLLSRREMLARCGTGLGTIALAGVLADEAVQASVDPLAVKAPHFPAKAKHVVHLFMNGGPSQVDTFDPKPALDKYHGKPIPTGNLRTERKTGAAMRSPFKFRKYGKSGIEVSELFAKTAAHIDDMCVIRSMYADVPNHEPSLLADELRRRPAAAAEPRQLGDLRPRQREPQPARLRRHVPRRLPDRHHAELAVARSCPASTRAPTSTASTRESTSSSPTSATPNCRWTSSASNSTSSRR